MPSDPDLRTQNIVSAMRSVTPDPVIHVQSKRNLYIAITGDEHGHVRLYTGQSQRGKPLSIQPPERLNATTPTKHLRIIHVQHAQCLTPPAHGDPLLVFLHALTSTHPPLVYRRLLLRLRAVIRDSSWHEGWARQWRCIDARRTLRAGAFWRSQTGQFTVVQYVTSGEVLFHANDEQHRLPWPDFVTTHAPSTPVRIPFGPPRPWPDS